MIRYVGGDGFVAERRGAEVRLTAAPGLDIRAEVLRLLGTARTDTASAVTRAMKIAEAVPMPTAAPSLPAIPPSTGSDSRAVATHVRAMKDAADTHAAAVAEHRRQRLMAVLGRGRNMVVVQVQRKGRVRARPAMDSEVVNAL